MEDKELLFRTHAKSKVACLNETLLAYLENSLSMSKITVARVNFIRVLARYRQSDGQSVGTIIKFA
jgi:hypothetical protein